MPKRDRYRGHRYRSELIVEPGRASSRRGERGISLLSRACPTRAESSSADPHPRNAANILLTPFRARLARDGASEGTVEKCVAGITHFVDWLGDQDPAHATQADHEDYLDTWYEEAQPWPSTFRFGSRR